MFVRTTPALSVLVLVASMVACSGGGSGSSTPAPAITSGFGASAATVVVSDGQTTVETVTAVHPDPAETLTFTIDGGADQTSFSIDPATGKLDLVIPPDYANPADVDLDNVYEVRVAVVDSLGARDKQTISVVVGFNVDTLEDVVNGDLTAGDRSLREAIEFVFDGDAVSFSPALSGQTIVLTGGQITIAKNLMIDGDLDNDGGGDITIDANAVSRIFEFDDGSGTPDRDLRLSGLWLTNGMVAGPGGAILNRENLTVVDCFLWSNHATGTGNPGGAISSGPGNLTIEGTTVAGNSTAGRDGHGGGISNVGGRLSLVSSVVAQNEATLGGHGGGIYSTGEGIGSSIESLVVRKTDVDDNVAGSTSGRGGGVYVGTSSYTIEQSTIRYNEAATGGGLFSYTSNTRQLGTIVNSTVHGNRAAREGGGLYLRFNKVRIFNSTITSNMAGRRGGGMMADEFDPDFRHSFTEVGSSIVASNAPSDVEFDVVFTGLTPYTTRGGNVIGLGDVAGFGASEVIGAADPQLENLDLFGGETYTRPPLPTSPAIDAGSNSRHLSTDQRGEVRTFGGRTDAGAVERNDKD